MSIYTGWKTIGCASEETQRVALNPKLNQDIHVRKRQASIAEVNFKQDVWRRNVKINEKGGANIILRH